jgi:hypothetical protein
MEELMVVAQSKTLDQAIDELVKDYKKAAKKAAEYATKKIREDIYARSLDVLQKYYDSYTKFGGEPKSYDRTYRLKESFVPFSSVVERGNQIQCSVGIVYDHTRLDGYYYGSKKYQPTDSAWIVDNYLDGIHPTTNGSSIPSDFIGPLFDGQERAQYIPVKDSYSPTFRMDGYFEVCKKRFSNYMMISFMDQLLRM